MWETLQSWPGAVTVRGSSTLYLLVNAAHILGIGLILGPILVLDARLLGVARRVPLAAIGPLLVAASRIGVIVAIMTGLTLFTVRPADYADNTAFLIKIGIVLLAVANALSVDLSKAWQAAITGHEIAARLRWQAAASFILWPAALVAGRWIGFL